MLFAVVDATASKAEVNGALEATPADVDTVETVAGEKALVGSEGEMMGSVAEMEGGEREMVGVVRGTAGGEGETVGEGGFSVTGPKVTLGRDEASIDEDEELRREADAKLWSEISSS
jgi:hypothetical protein